MPSPRGRLAAHSFAKGKVAHQRATNKSPRACRFGLTDSTSAQTGYIGRIQLNSNPWNQGAFELQICAIILAPTLICISIYLTLKHIILALNPALSRVRPKLLPFIFVPADVSCLLLQAIGGGLAAQGKKNVGLLNTGNHVIITGIALQVVVLLAFGSMCLDYYVRVRRWLRTDGATAEARALWADRKFRMFACAVLGAYLCVQIRCIYR